MDGAWLVVPSGRIGGSNKTGTGSDHHEGFPTTRREREVPVPVLLADSLGSRVLGHRYAGPYHDPAGQRDAGPASLSHPTAVLDLRKRRYLGSGGNGG